MVEKISDFLYKKTNELVFTRDQRTSGYDYQNYTPNLTVKRIPKKQIVFFFTNMTTKVNFDSLYNLSLYKKMLFKVVVGVCFIQSFLMLMFLFGIHRFEWTRWLYLFLPFSFIFHGIGVFVMAKNFVNLKKVNRNRKVYEKLRAYLDIENIYWFNKYRIIFETDPDNLDIRLVIADEMYNLNNKEVQLINVLTENLDEIRLNNLKADHKQKKISVKQNKESRAYDWDKMEIKMFLKYNQF